MSKQRPNSEVERVTATGHIRHCIDCEAWFKREEQFYQRMDATGQKRWSSRCKLCQCAHDSERKAKRYAELHPNHDTTTKRGRPRLYAAKPEHEPSATAKPAPKPCWLAKFWHGILSDLPPMPALEWMRHTR